MAGRTHLSRKHNPSSTLSPRRLVAPLKPVSAAAKPATQQADTDGARPLGSEFLKHSPALVVSVLVHVLAILVLALIITLPPQNEKILVITSSATEADEDFQDFQEQSPVEIIEQDQDVVTDAAVATDAAVVAAVDVAIDVPVVSSADDLDAAPFAAELTVFSAQTVLAADLTAVIGAGGDTGGGFGRRSGGRRSKLALAHGGSRQSEQAVEAALKWLAAHQLPDGSWTLDLQACPSCKGQCQNSGQPKISAKAGDLGVTALVLLPFLGAGYTHVEGPYRKQVAEGISFLCGSVTQRNAGHGYELALTSMALCEAYAMTKDQSLGQAAQMAIGVVQSAQDPAGGGWGYTAGAAGITSVTGFMVTACKSADLAGLAVDPVVVKNASRFLDSMEYTHAGGTQYRYNSDFVNGEFRGSRTDADSESARALSIAATLCRMFMGYKKDDPSIRQTVDRIVHHGPSIKKPYYNYYATQVVHHYGGEAWQRWNPAMRDLLVSTQNSQAHEAGSWHFEEDQLAGRVYCTAMATMVLEVYYRTLPIYGKQTVEQEFRE